MARRVLALLLPALAAACTTRIRVGTFDEATPGALAIMSDWLNDDPNECWTFYRQPSGGRSTAKLEAGDLDVAYVGSTPFAAAAARRGRLKAVAVAHKKGEAQALITRARLAEPKDLPAKTIAAPYVSTTHYIALAVIANAGLDLTTINLRIMAPADIVAAWDAGEIDGACVWGTTMSHLLNNGWGGSVDALDQGRIMVPAETVADWNYETGNVVAASDAFISNHAALVKKFVVAVARTQYDYVASIGQGDWSATGAYTDAVAGFAYLGADSGVGAFERADAFARLARFEFLSVADQLDADKIDVPTMTQDSAYFFYEQKVLAEDPSGADQRSHYEASYNTTTLTGLTTGDYQLLLNADPAFSATNEADVQREVASDPKCAEAFAVTSFPLTFDDGSTGTNAYANTTECRWTFTPSSGLYVNIAITKLMSEQPVDGLEVYDEVGDLLAAFTGRLVPTDLPDVRSSDQGGRVTVRWATDNYDENAIGALEDVGFGATASETGNAPNGGCSDGVSGASCEYDYCLGVVDITSTGVEYGRHYDYADTIQSQAAGRGSYAPNSRCGWRIAPAGDYVELEFTRLALENGVDFVRIYEGSVAPAGFSLESPAPAPKLIYAATGSTPPPKLVFEGDVFVTFESDGLGNQAVDGDGNLMGGGFTPRHKSVARPADCAGTANCAGCPWTSPVKNCALRHCTGDSTLAAGPATPVLRHGKFSSSAGSVVSAADATDYPAKTTCRWSFEVPYQGLAGLSFRAPVWDVEASGTLTSTTDAVKIYGDGGALVGTLTGDDGPDANGNLGEFALGGTGGTFVAVFESDLNNPVPKKGFDLAYAGKYGAAPAGTNGGFCVCDFGGDCDWPCGEEAPACGGTCHVPSKEGTSANVGQIIGIFLGILLAALALMGAYMYWQHAQHQKQMDAMAQELKDAIVGFKVCIKDHVPAAHSTGAAAVDASQRGTWYWQEEVHRMGSHAAASTKPPHWVAFAPDVQEQLERALSTAGTVAAAHYHIDTGKMEQMNMRTQFKRPVLRDTSEAGATRAATMKQKGRVPLPGADTQTRPEELWDQDGLLLRKDSIVQVSKQREDGWIYGSVVLNAGDEGRDARAYVEDGISLSSGWFPESVSDVPTADQLKEMQKAMGGGDEALATPKYWEAVKDPLMAQYFPLRPESEEYRRVYDAINLTTGPQQLHIHSVERVQNIGLWQSYCVKKSQIVSRPPGPRPTNRSGSQVRNWLFHGCGPDVVDKILQQGFNRSFCGKNATLFGKGVYFARDASYSTYPLYSPPDARGLQTIFAVRCVVGEWSQGVRDGLTPAVRDDAKNLLYDTTVDDMRRPSIFVTYHDAQAYPEYRVRFNQANPARSHPKAKQPEPGGYQGNRLAGIEGEAEARAAPPSALDNLRGAFAGQPSLKVAPAAPDFAGHRRTF